MAITYREVKGSALTIEELDNNFRHFTGSQAVSGTFIVSGSVNITGSVDIAGSITSSGNISASSLSGNSITSSGNISASSLSGNSITSSGNISASSFSGNGNDLNFSELQVNSTSLPPGVAVNFSQSSTNTVAAVQVVGEFRVSGSKTTHLNYNQQSTMVNYIRERVIMDELPTSKPATIGELWISGSDAAGTSGYLMVVKS